MKSDMQTSDLLRTQRITVTLPGYLVQQLTRSVPKRTVSRFVAQAVSDKLGDVVAGDPVDEFFTLAKKFRRETKRRFTTKQILRAIHKGRT